MPQGEYTGTLDIRQAAEQMLLSLYAPPGVVVNSQGMILSIHGRTREYIVPPTTAAYNVPVFNVVHDDIRKPLIETLRASIHTKTITISTPQYISDAAVPTFVAIAVRPLSTASDNEFYLITFDNAAAQMTRDEAETQITQALQQSEQRYKQMVQSVTDYIFSVTIEHGSVVHTQHGANCVAVTGYTSQEYYANPMLWIDMVHPADRDVVIAQAQHILLEKRAYPLEHRIIHKNGSVRWVKNTTVIRTNEWGEMIGYDGLMTDVTDLKEAEMQIRESEEQFRVILEQSPLGVALTNINNRIVKANAVFCEMLGYTEAELKKFTIADITFEEDRAKEIALTESLKQGTVQVARLEKRYVTKTQEIIWVTLHSSFIHDTNGRPVFALGIAENISARKHAESALRNSEARLSALLQNSNDAVVITDKEGKFTYASPSIARLFYYSPTNLVGKQAFLHIHPDDQDSVRAIYRTLVEMPLNAMKTYHYRYRRADSTWASVESVSTNLLKHPLIQGIVTNTRDITARDEHEEEEEE